MVALHRSLTAARTRRVLIVCVTLMLAACGTKHQHHRSLVEGRGTDWKADGHASTAPLLLSTPRVGDSFLSLAVQSDRIEREYSFDMVRHESRQSRDPNVMAMAVGVTTLGLFCLVSDDCFGDSGEWRGGDARRENIKPTGRTRPLVEPYTGSVRAAVLLQAYDAAGLMIGEQASNISSSQGVLRVPVKDMAERLPDRPERVIVTTSLHNTRAQPSKVTVRADELRSMKLYAERWLPPAERQPLILARLKERMLAGDHAGALPQFAALEALQLPLPPSFLYHYAQSLLKTGAAARGRSYLENYIAASGDAGTYTAEARLQLAQL